MADDTGTPLTELVRALMGRIGDASRVALAEQALAAYAELDDRDLVRCLVEAGLIVGINSIEGVSDE